MRKNALAPIISPVHQSGEKKKNTIMKKITSLPLLLVALSSLSAISGCGSGDSQIKNVSMVASTGKDSVTTLNDFFALYFKKDSQLPYISLNDGVKFLNFLKAARFDDTANQNHYFRLSQNGDNPVITDERGNTLSFDLTNQTLTYSDFDSFLTYVDRNLEPLSIGGSSIRRKLVKSSATFTKGNSVTIDLKPYKSIGLTTYKEKVYLPLVTFNDLVYNPMELASLAYNGKAVYMVSDGDLYTKNKEGKQVLTSYGQRYFDVPHRELSEEERNLYFDELCLVFDNEYGLKKEKGLPSFSSFIEEKGFAKDFQSLDPKKLDEALQLSLSYFNDGHTSFTLQSPLYPFGQFTYDDSRFNPVRDKWLEDGEKLSKSRPASAPLGNSIDEENKTFYIAFNEFTECPENSLYSEATFKDQETINSNTAAQFASAYRYLNSDEAKGKIDTVVVDLSTNDGGSSDSLIYSLCTLVGEAKVSTKNPITGAKNDSRIKADLNLDGVIDDKDVGLVDKGYNVAIMSSQYTFSCGNALPALAKTSNPKIKTLGETSGGGACIVHSSVSNTGSSFVLSGLTELMMEKDGTLTTVEKGVEADVAIAQSSMFDRDAVSKKAKEAFAK